MTPWPDYGNLERRKWIAQIRQDQRRQDRIAMAKAVIFWVSLTGLVAWIVAGGWG